MYSSAADYNNNNNGSYSCPRRVAKPITTFVSDATFHCKWAARIYLVS